MSYQQNEEDDKFFQDMNEFINVLKQQTLSPQILEFKKEIFESLKEAVQDQNKRIKTFVQPDPQGNDISNHEKNLKELIYHTETEKISYLLKQYLRVRLRKIEKFAFYLTTKHTGMIHNLSSGEQVYLKNYSKLKYEHFYKTVLKGLHKRFHHLGGIQSRYEQQENEEKQPFQFESQQTKIDLREPNLKEYCFGAITDNPQRIRFNDKIQIGNVMGDKVIPTDQVIYTTYENLQHFIKQGNGYLI